MAFSRTGIIGGLSQKERLDSPPRQRALKGKKGRRQKLAASARQFSHIMGIEYPDPTPFLPSPTPVSGITEAHIVFDLRLTKVSTSTLRCTRRYLPCSESKFVLACSRKRLKRKLTRMWRLPLAWVHSGLKGHA